MASIIKFKSGGHKFVTYDVAILCWKWKTGEEKGIDPGKRRYACNIEDVTIERSKRYLAPQSYLDSHPVSYDPDQIDAWREGDMARKMGVRN